MQVAAVALLALSRALPAAAGPAPPVSKTGDVLVVPGAKLGHPNNKIVADPAAPGGKAVESVGKGGDMLVASISSLPAGHYLVTARIQVRRRQSPQHIGRMLVNAGRLVPDDERTVPFDTSDFPTAGVYRDFSFRLVAAPLADGRSRIRVRVKLENPKAPIRVASIRVEALAVGPVVVTKVWPAKLLAKPGRPQPITVSVANTTDHEQTGLKLVLDLLHGVGQTQRVGTKPVTLKALETAEITFPWNTGQREYGYEARATLLSPDGKALSRHADYFAVSRSHFKLRIMGAPRRSRSYLDKRSALRSALYHRMAYSNYVEVYGWAPSAFVELYPRHRFWTSGQVCAWQYDRDVMKAWIDEMHRLGLWVTAYNISLYNGWPGLEWMRKHPEWCAFDEKGRPVGGVNAALWPTRQTAYNDTEPPPKMTFIGEMPNNGTVWPRNDELMRHAADEIVQIQQKLGFDGMRWDGHPIVYITKKQGAIVGTGFGKMIWNHKGERIVDVVPDQDLDAQSLHNIRLIKQTVRKVAPDFEWGYNAGYDLTAEQQPRTWREVATGAGIWIEGGFRSGDEPRADPTNTWAKYIRKLWMTSQFVIRSGGYPIHGALAADTKLVRRFLNAIFFAQGSHVCWHGGTWGEYLDLSRFATRYCQYLYDPNLHPYWGDPDIHVTGWIQFEDRNAKAVKPLATEARIEAPRPLFFPEKMLFHREISATRKDTVLHLVNHPLKPYIDYTEMNAPPVQENITVALHVPEGMRPRDAWCLSPDRWPMEEKLAVQPAGAGWIKLTVPRLECWNIVVVAWTKEG